MTSEIIGGRAQRAEMWRNRIAKLVAVIAPLIIATVVIMLTQQVKTASYLRQEEQEAQERRAVLLELLSVHQDIETGSRGYVITGDPPFLEPYEAGRKELLQIWPQLYRNNPRESATIDNLRAQSERKLQLSETAIAVRRDGDKAGAEARVRTGRGKAAMDEIRRLIGMLLAHQQSEIDETTRRSETAIANLRDVSFALLGALAALLVMAWMALHNSLRAREKALVESEDLALRQKAILDSAMDGIVTLNPSGSIESANAATLRMFGYEQGELDRRDAGILFASRPPIGRVAERLREMDILNGGGGTSHEVMGRRSDGRDFPTEVALTATRLNEGVRYVAVIRDVTERKRVDQLKSDFVSTVSHELRTPLTSIAGALGLLNGGGAGPVALGERAERLVSIAYNNANRLIRLINDILDMEKIESGKMPFDNRELDLKVAVAASIEEMRSYAAQMDVKFSLSAPMTLMLVSADRDRLAQVLTNLLSNACKFSPAGDTVEVAIGTNGSFHRITVADHGPGIPDDFRDRIFTKFAQADSSSRREKGGTGLGLSIVSEIVQRLDGRITFESEPGHGTRFHVDLPVLPRPAEHMTTKRLSLLVCGDGAGTAYSDALREAGYAVTFMRGRESVGAVLGSRKFDGIVVDMGLPQGEGIEIVRMIREEGRYADTPVLVLGGQPGASALDGAAALVLDWLDKPIDVDRLVESVEAASTHLHTNKPRVLHIEDDRDIQHLVATALGGVAEVVFASGVADARAMLREHKFDLAILDLSLADGDGAELLPELRREGEVPLPVVIFSAQDADPKIAHLVDAYLAKARTPIGELVSIVGRLAAGDENGSGAL